MTTPTMSIPTRRSGRDDGSMLLAFLFAMAMFSVILIITATIVAGTSKTNAARNISVQQQAADAALAHAQTAAQLGRWSTTAGRTGSGTLTPGTTWSWTATPAAGDANSMVVVGRGTLTGRADRRFEATFRRIYVSGVRTDPTSGAVTYLVPKDAMFSSGFFARETLTFAAPVFLDGYNNSPGLVGTNSALVLNTSTVRRAEYWNSTALGTDGRCSGTGCGDVEATTFGIARDMQTGFITTQCATGVLPAWNATSSGALTNGACYASLNFNANYSGPAVEVYTTGAVSVATGVQVNQVGSLYQAPSGNLRIYSTGTTVTAAASSRTGAAVYAPNANCAVNGGTDTTYNTRFFGALVCRNVTVSGNSYLRYDGALQLLPAQAAAHEVWVMSGYRAL